MAAVCAANGGDMRRMPGVGQPVVNRRTNAPAFDWRIAGPVRPGNQQENSIARRHGLIQGSVDGPPSGIEIHAVKIEGPVRLDRAATETLVPTAVEGSMLKRCWWR